MVPAKINALLITRVHSLLRHIVLFSAINLSYACLNASITSTTNTIHFDVNSDGIYESTLNSTGLALGMNLTPSVNLHVSGNTIVSEYLSVGSSQTMGSNLNISGSIGWSNQTISSNGVIAGHSHTFIDSSGGNLNLSLPYAGNVSGMLIHLKKVSVPYSITILGGGNLIDESRWFNLESDTLSGLSFLSNGLQWYILGESETGSSAGWIPSDTTLHGWWDPSDISTVTYNTSTGNVSILQDKSSNLQDLEQTDETEHPTIGTRYLNGLRMIHANGEQFLEDTDFTVPGSGNFSIFMVAKVENVSNQYDSVYSLNASSDEDFQFSAGDGAVFNGQVEVDNLGNNAVLTGGPFTGPSIFNVSLDYSASGNSYAYIDGTLHAISDYDTVELDTNQKLRIFSNRSAAQSLEGIFGEIITVESVSPSLRKTIEGYLAWKWGLSDNLPNDHPYKHSAP
ncbi:MAG: hypothetical protein HQL32_13435 [Planctomycetes bacterium]|nr:hypothetical protein [Planctomycetota bacterium]